MPSRQEVKVEHKVSVAAFTSRDVNDQRDPELFHRFYSTLLYFLNFTVNSTALQPQPQMKEHIKLLIKHWGKK